MATDAAVAAAHLACSTLTEGQGPMVRPVLPLCLGFIRLRGPMVWPVLPLCKGLVQANPR